MMKPPEFDDPTGFYTKSATYWPGISDMGAEAFPLGMKLTRGRERSTPRASFLGKRPEREGSAPAHPRSMGGVRTRILLPDRAQNRHDFLALELVRRGMQGIDT
ncbi:uncharacterized protein SCHCODRAFT_02073219 [Schizophyllum commune H4-8]|uniref:uncharacterized protein n=1 Tax=Schizophyllum commune (strain H4-8 / FGSC 9210) TaxID=578458 RepID=UPI00215E9FD2|nr:uncharacterized protein SCHCODRAFT_02073219 [Schizophyllum commune H4-8]KAI5887835.1 hypothetical protein SCHCODRAFT_02073219 [Schizophyllum commune H4-8]